jgi:hypothetical protein
VHLDGSFHREGAKNAKDAKKGKKGKKKAFVLATFAFLAPWR